MLLPLASPVALVVAMLGACTPDLTALEQRQRVLERELVEMEAEIAALEATLESAGVEIAEPGGERPRKRRGKAKRRRGRKAKVPDDGLPVAGHQDPDVERTEAAGATVTRTGKPPALPGLPQPERTETACGWKLQVPALSAISDYPLNTRGLGRSGPLLLSLGGDPLAPHAPPAGFERECGGAFRHAGGVILFAPDDSPNLDGRTLEWSLDPRVPMPRGGDGRPMYWAYPGTTLAGTVASWAAEWGDADAVIAGLVVGDGPVEIRFGDSAPQVLPPGPFRVSHRFAGDGPFTMTVTGTPSDTGLGGYALIDAWTVGNAANAVVFTGDAAWRP
jgi:hypothetical protein